MYEYPDEYNSYKLKITETFSDGVSVVKWQCSKCGASYINEYQLDHHIWHHFMFDKFLEMSNIDYLYGHEKKSLRVYQDTMFIEKKQISEITHLGLNKFTIKSDSVMEEKEYYHCRICGIILNDPREAILHMLYHTSKFNDKVGKVYNNEGNNDIHETLFIVEGNFKTLIREGEDMDAN